MYVFLCAQVIQNLHISHLELRDDNSIDIMPYINKRKIDIILVPLSDELAAFKEKYIVIMDRHVKSLIQCNILKGQTANISKGRVINLIFTNLYSEETKMTVILKMLMNIFY